jgi:hypothetical protein
MKSRTIGKLVLIYAPTEQGTADLIGSACKRAIELISESWGLGAPDDCRIYVMTSWLGFVFQSAPWSWRILLGATLPLWAFRARRTWRYSAAWTQRYGKRVAIGVKPPRLFQTGDLAHRDRLGIRMFVEEKDPRANVQHVTCHELVHACSAHLKLPTWLNEGIATVTVDRFLGSPTIRWETLPFMRDYVPKTPPLPYRDLTRMGMEAIAYHGIRGYWLTRYLEETRPGFLKDLFAQHKDAKAMDREIISELGIGPERFWHDIDGVMTLHFENTASIRT